MPGEWAPAPAGGRSMSWEGCKLLDSEDGVQAFAELVLLAGAGRRDEYGVVAGNGADHLGPAGGIDGHRHALRRADGGFEHGEIGAGGLHARSRIA